MARINLLPWREARRQRRRRDFLVAVGVAVAVTLALGFGSQLQVDRMIADQQSRNAFLNEEIRRLDRQIREIEDLEKTKARLLARMDIIQRLQESRPEVVHLFDELVDTIPDGVFLTSVAQQARSVVVEGRAQSNARVSAFMRNIENSTWVDNPILLLIENKEKTGDGLSRFRLRFDQHGPHDEAA